MYSIEHKEEPRGLKSYKRFKRIWTAVKRNICHKTGRNQDTHTLLDAEWKSVNFSKGDKSDFKNERHDHIQNSECFSEERIDAIANGSWMANLRFSPIDKTRRDIMIPLNREDYRQRLYVRLKPYRQFNETKIKNIRKNK